MGVTINTVNLSPAFREVLYILMAVLFVLLTIVFTTNKQKPLSALKRSFVSVFFIAGMLYALHADLGWSTWLATDIRTFAGLTTDEKLLKLEGGLYDFVRKARTVVKDDYQIFSTDSYFAFRSEYFLLPLRKRDNAPYLIVLADDTAHYDQKTRTFTRGDIKVHNVDILLAYAPNAYILVKR